ncbi:MAG: HAMP domain-containing protein [Acaryochloridaceae cyanobacterium RL_2_7]|nr:HAMP domain-containing protein [Acaryochloridaceae cyanobacterium RL_2_7]
MNHRKPWQSLRLRLIAWYSLLAGLSMIISNGFMSFLFQQTLLRQVDNTLEILTIQAKQNLDDEVDILQFDPRENAPILGSLLEEAGVSVTLLDQNGVVTEQFGQLLATPSTHLRSGFQTVEESNERWRTYTEKIPSFKGRPSGWLRLSHSLQYVDISASEFLYHQLLEIPLMLILVGFGGLFLANRALKPIDKITQMAKSVRVSGDLTQRIQYQGAADELERLTTMFNEMLEALQKNFEREKRFTADTSHELRTPLTAIKGRLTVTLSQPRTVEDYQETLKSIELEVDRLTRLSSDLLFLSQLEQQHLNFPLEPVDLSDLLAAIAEQIQPMAQLCQIELSTDIDANIQILGSPDHLIRLFLNLLDNAVKYTPHNGTINLGTQIQRQGVEVIVSDTGKGIPQAHLSHLFERFYQVEQSRSNSKEGKGAGLGLAIVQEIVHRHQGQIAVTSQLGQGTTFTVTFPQPPLK